MDLEKLKKGLKGGHKGQAVMEYLITYGLALFVILIVLAILVAVVLPQLKAPETCQFSQPGFGCSTKQHVIYASTDNNYVTAIIQLDNQQGRDIHVDNVICTSEPAGNLNSNSFAGAMEPYSPQLPIRMNAGAATTVTMPCYDLSTTAQVMMAPGASFKGSIGVLYGYNDEVAGAPERLAVATITGTVQTGPTG